METALKQERELKRAQMEIEEKRERERRLAEELRNKEEITAEIKNEICIAKRRS